MSVEASAVNIDNQQVHEILTAAFTDRYLAAAKLGAVASSVAYDPTNSLCDYEQTWWPAQPSARCGIPAANFILGQMHHLKSKQIEQLCVRPFAEKAERLTAALHEMPVLLVNGHSPDLQAALSSVSAQLAIARFNRGSSRRNFEELARISHVVGTRGFAPVMLHLPGLKHPAKSLVSIAQWVMNPHLSFPNNRRMRESALPRDFRSAYNDRFKADCLAVIQTPTTHPRGYHTLWSTPPGGTHDEPGYHVDGRDIIVTARVETGTTDLIKAMGCALLPIYTSFQRHHTAFQVGNLVRPEDMNHEALTSIMAGLAQFRRGVGETNVFYADEPEVLST